jgi:hypothetical protein
MEDVFKVGGKKRPNGCLTSPIACCASVALGRKHPKSQIFGRLGRCPNISHIINAETLEVSAVGPGTGSVQDDLPANV